MGLSGCFFGGGRYPVVVVNHVGFANNECFHVLQRCLYNVVQLSCCQGIADAHKDSK